MAATNRLRSRQAFALRDERDLRPRSHGTHEARNILAASIQRGGLSWGVRNLGVLSDLKSLIARVRRGEWYQLY